MLPLLALAKSPTLWLAGGIAAAAFAGYMYYMHTQNTILSLELNNSTLKSNQVILQATIDSEKEALDRTKEQYEVLFREFSELQEANEQAEAYSESLIKILTKHDLEYLALKKPGLIENRINNATKKIFSDIESITTN